MHELYEYIAIVLGEWNGRWSENPLAKRIKKDDDFKFKLLIFMCLLTGTSQWSRSGDYFLKHFSNTFNLLQANPS